MIRQGLPGGISRYRMRAAWIQVFFHVAVSLRFLHKVRKRVGLGTNVRLRGCRRQRTRSEQLQEDTRRESPTGQVGFNRDRFEKCFDVVGEFMKPVFLHQGCLKKSTVLGHAEQFANNIYPEQTPRTDTVGEPQVPKLVCPTFHPI